jgi:hypothetical protein
MSELDDAMLERMIHIVYDEHKPFSYLDFIDLMKPKTYRNKVSKLKKDGIVELDIKSIPAFYTLKGCKFGKSGTPTHTVVFPLNNNDPLYKTLQNLPFGSHSIHDIRLRFNVPNIYETLTLKGSRYSFNFPRNTTSGDIPIPSFFKDNAIVRIIIHKTDVVSVIIGCSKQPIPLDTDGLIRFFGLLVRAEERLQFLLSSLFLLDDNQAGIPFPVTMTMTTTTAATTASATTTVIPQYQSWIITMWHFGRDTLIEYNGAKFSRTIEDAQHILTRIYSKDYGNGKGKRKRMRIREETQEYPGKTVVDAIEEKLELEEASQLIG